MILPHPMLDTNRFQAIGDDKEIAAKNGCRNTAPVRNLAVMGRESGGR
jgi:hypothetical protein